MNYRLSISLLAISASLVVGSSAMAAPGVAYKKRLDVPMVPASAIKQVQNMPWVAVDGQTTLKFHHPALGEEKDCGNVIYRSWVVFRDVGDAGLSYRLIMEARTPTKTKWVVLPNEYTFTVGGFSTPLEDKLTDAETQLFSCHGQDLILKTNLQTHENNRTVLDTFLTPVRFANFDKHSEWTDRSRQLMLNRDRTNLARTHYATFIPKTVDGIDQMPGILHVENGAITGDSRPVTFDQKNAIHQHGLPYYRDLRNLPENTRLTILFFRTKDGYAVDEWQHATDGQASKMTSYRIRNGEAQYSVVDSLPVTKSSRLTSIKDSLAYEGDQTIIVHGVPPELGYRINGSILWETDAQAYMRYIINDTSTRKQQYWEATVNKN